MTTVIKLGDPPQSINAVFDSAMTEIWSLNCKILNCTGPFDPYASFSNYPMNEEFDLEMTTYPLLVNGTFRGTWFKDQFDFGNLLLIGMDYLLIDVAPLLGDLQYGASVGIGRVARSSANQTALIDLLALAKVIQEKKTSFVHSSTNVTGPGKIFFGTSDPSLYEDPMNLHPVFQPEKGFWSVQMTSVSVGSLNISLSTGAVLDTTFPLITAPISAFQAICAYLGFTDIKPYSKPGTLYATVPCGAIPGLSPLIFTIDGKDYSIAGDRYVQAGSDGNCYFMIVGADIPAPNGPMWIFGELFMEEKYILFDQDNELVGIAKSLL